MRVLIQSYDNFAQNKAGGVYSKVMNYIKSAEGSDVLMKPFDKWQDKLKDYDIIHYFGLKLEFIDQMKLAKNLGLKIVISSIITPTSISRIKTKLFLGKKTRLHSDEEKFQCMFNMADAIITETGKEREFIITAYGVCPGKVHIIPNGISDEILGGDPSLLKTKLGISKDFVLQVGRFDDNKNQLSVIKAMNGMDIPVVFVGGEDPAYKEYYLECKRCAQDNIYFAGWIDHSDPLMASAYAGAKVVVLPSFHEIFGNAIFEGAMAGANIVATKVLPLEEFGFSNHSITISPDSIASIKEAIVKSYNMDRDPLFPEFVRKQYSLESVYTMHLNIYKGL